MLKRLYIDNFRCLVNFELRLDRINLLLGANGSGKTSVFDALRSLQAFIIGDARLQDVFPGASLTRWQKSDRQRFEIECDIANDRYVYVIVVEHDLARRRQRVWEESLKLNDRPLFVCQEGMAQLYRDDHSEGPRYPFDWTLSGVGSLHERPDNQKLTRFKRALAKWIIVRPFPPLMEQESRGEQDRLTPYMENFVSWYRHLAQEHLGAMVTLLQELRHSLPGFDTLSLKEAGEDTRTLKALFALPGEGRPVAYDFAELSDGQKMLIALYTLLFGTGGDGVYLFIDEPDNFLALREIQPWLSHLSDALGKSLEQAVLISHHPEIINYLGSAYGRWLERDGQGPVRVSARIAPVSGLTLAETIARAWEQ